jgi:hypothetical protein
MHKNNNTYIQILVRKPEWKRPFVKSRHRYIRSAHSRGQWWPLVSTVMSLQVP